MLWSSELQVNTLHTRDWCRAAWTAALWCSARSRSDANSQAGEDLPRIIPRDKAKFGGLNTEIEVEHCCPRVQTPRAPVFNVVDDGNTNQ